MTFSLHREQHGLARSPFAACFAFLAWLCVACVAPSAAGQLKVGQPLDFGSASVGSPVKLDVVFFATGTTTVASASVLTDGATGQDFTPGSNSCLGTVQQGTNCAISISFIPKQVGARHGVLLLYDGGHNLLSQVFLHGLGMGGAFAFAPANVTSTNLASGLSPATFTSGSAVLDGYGNLYFTDIQNQRILAQAPSGAISQVASLPVSATSAIAIGADGTLFVSSQSSVFAFQPGTTPVPLNTGSVRLVSPGGLAVDALGTLYIADVSTGLIARYSLETGQTSTVPLATLAPALSSPKGLAIDAGNNLYIADSGNDRVVAVSAGSGNTSILGFSGLALNNPTGLAVDPAGTVYVADTGNSRLVELTVNGTSFVLSDPNLRLTTPSGVLIRPNGDLLLSDTTLGQVSVPRSMPSISFPTPTLAHTLDVTDGAQALTLQATGNSVTQLVFPATGPEPTVSSNAFTVTSAGTCPSINLGGSYTPLQFSIGDICTYTVTFTPTAAGVNTASFEVDISLPSGSATYNTVIPLTGTGLSSIASFSLVASPNATAVGAPVGLTLTALNASNGIATDFTGSVTFTTTDATGVFPGGGTYTLTAANQGVLVLPPSSGVQFNQPGSFTVQVTDGQRQATSNAVVVRAAAAIGSYKSSVNPALPSQSTTLSATVTSNGPAPTGTITFYSGATVLGTATLTNAGANLPVSFAAAGSYTLTAVYSGDVSNAPVTSPALIQVVQFTPQVTGLASSVNPALVGQSTTLSVSLTSASPTLTGSVKFYDGGTLIGTGSVSNGAASAAVSFSTAGAHALTAVYSGDMNNAAVTSAPLSQAVVNSTTTTLASSANPSNLNQPVTFTATVSSSGATPTGSVSFYRGSVLLTTVTLPTGSGVATYTTSSLAAGTDAIRAIYSGDANTATSSSTLSQIVLNPATIQFNCPASAALANTPIALTATVTSSGVVPTGTVRFFSGSTLLGTGTLAGGAATLSASFPAAGTQTLSATYSGDADSGAATSSSCSLQVLQPATISLTSSANPSTAQQSIALTATVTSAGPTPGGLVKFFNGPNLLAIVGLTNGAAVVNYTFPTAGLDNLSAVYLGDGSTSAATSAVLPQTVRSRADVSLTTAFSPILIGNPDMLSVAVTSTGVTPTGTVTFLLGTAPIGTATLVNGTASLPVSFSTTGYLTLTAVYSGDAGNAPAGSSGVLQVVGDVALVVAPGLPASVSVLAGGTAQYSFIVTPLVADPLPSAITFSASGLPKGATATFTPATVAAGQSTTLVALSITVPAITGQLRGQPPLPPGLTPRRAAPIAAALLLLPMAFLRRRRLSQVRNKLATLLMLLLMAAGATGLSGCISAANSGFYGLTPQTYPITVTATSGQVSRTATVSLTVQ